MMKTGVAKITLLGDSTTGKTSIAYRMVNKKFREHNESTIGASFLTLKIDDMRLDIWDTAGQERYLSLCKMYYRNSDVFVLVYDLSDQSNRSVSRLVYYLDSIILEIKYEYKIIIVGNKLDINRDCEKFEQEIRTKLEGYNIKDKVDFISVSAKTGENFTQLMDLIKNHANALNNNKKDKLSSYNNSIVLKPSDPVPDVRLSWNRCPC